MDILAFCRKRDISSEGINITQSVKWSRKQTNISRILLNVELPPHFPDKYDTVVQRAVDKCLVASLGKGLDDLSFSSQISRTSEK